MCDAREAARAFEQSCICKSRNNCRRCARRSTGRWGCFSETLAAAILRAVRRCPHSQKSPDAADEHKHPFICACVDQEKFCRTETVRTTPDCLLQANVQVEDRGKKIAMLLGVGTAIDCRRRRSAAPAESGMELAPAQDSGAPSGAGAGASQRGDAGNRDGGAAATGGSQGGRATRPSGDGSARVRAIPIERAAPPFVSVPAALAWFRPRRCPPGDRRAGAASGRRSRRDPAQAGARLCYSKPSTTVIRKKRYVHYREPSSTVVIKKRRPAVAVEGSLDAHHRARPDVHDGAQHRRDGEESGAASAFQRALLRRGDTVARARSEVARKQPPAAP